MSATSRSLTVIACNYLCRACRVLGFSLALPRCGRLVVCRRGPEHEPCCPQQQPMRHRASGTCFCTLRVLPLQLPRIDRNGPAKTLHISLACSARQNIAKSRRGRSVNLRKYFRAVRRLFQHLDANSDGGGVGLGSLIMVSLAASVPKVWAIFRHMVAELRQFC